METSLSGPCVTRGKDKRNEARRREKNATGNASDSSQECKRTGRGCDTISEIIHHSVRTNIGRHLRPDTRGSSSKRVGARMAHFFAVFLSFHFSSFLSSRHEIPNYCFYFTLSFFLFLFHPLFRLRFAPDIACRRFARARAREMLFLAVQKVNEREYAASWITRFCSSLGTTSNNGSDGLVPPASFLSAPLVPFIPFVSLRLLLCTPTLPGLVSSGT